MQKSVTGAQYTAAMTSSITFFYDIACPYAYIASQRIGPIAARIGAEVSWQPVLLGGIYKSIRAPQLPSQAWSPAKVAIAARDLHQQARLHGVPLHPPTHHPQRTVEAMRLLIAAEGDQRIALTHALYRAYWVEDRDLTQRSVLDEIARNNGVDPSVIDSPAAKQALMVSTAAAVELGAFGVPTFAARGRIWWGQDRLELMAQALTGVPPEPLPVGPGGQRVVFFHDFSSPFSYLASTQIAAIAARQGATVVWRPILLGALFRNIGTPNVPLLAMSAPRRRHALQDLTDWAARWGVHFTFPTTFPVRTVLPLRVSIAEPAATAHLYRALWVEDRDIGDPAVVEAVLSSAGLDGPALVQRASEPAIKAALRENTDAAQEAGACGVPAVVIGDTLLWGQDRLRLLERILAGTYRP